MDDHLLDLLFVASVLKSRLVKALVEMTQLRVVAKMVCARATHNPFHSFLSLLHMNVPQRDKQPRGSWIKESTIRATNKEVKT